MKSIKKIVYVHGFGGRDPFSDFEKKLRNFFEKINFRDRVAIESYSWNSGNINLKNLGYLWSEAKKEAENEAIKFANYINKLESDNVEYYIVAFSLGSFVVLNALNITNSLKNIKKVIFMGAASPNSFTLTKTVDSKILNYYSPNMDKVLSNLYNNIEGVPAGGVVGFQDFKSFQNIKTNFTHKIGQNYLELVDTIGWLISFKEGFIVSGETNINIPIKTLGGHTFWHHVYENDKIIIQYNAILGWYRALNSLNERLCWSKNLHAILKGLNITDW